MQAGDWSYFYPDVTVVRGPANFDERNRNLINPVGIVEILSTGTRMFDLNEKSAVYRAMPTVREVLLVDSERRRAIPRRRAPDGAWVTTEHTNGDILAFAEAEPPLDEVYRKTGL